MLALRVVRDFDYQLPTVQIGRSSLLPHGEFGSSRATSVGGFRPCSFEAVMRPNGMRACMRLREKVPRAHGRGWAKQTSFCETAGSGLRILLTSRSCITLPTPKTVAGAVAGLKATLFGRESLPVNPFTVSPRLGYKQRLCHQGGLSIRRRPRLALRRVAAGSAWRRSAADSALQRPI
jgi:hypothetical protein